MSKRKFLQLRVAMMQRDLDGQTLAAMAGMSANSLSNKLRGIYPFTAEEMRNIASILNIPPEQYFDYFVADFRSVEKGRH